MLKKVEKEAKKILELKKIDKKYYGIRNLKYLFLQISLLLFLIMVTLFLNIFYILFRPILAVFVCF